MFKRSIEAVIAEGLKNLQSQADGVARQSVEAQKVVTRCAEEIQALTRLAQEVPEKVFDRYSQVMIATFDIPSNAPLGYIALRTNCGDMSLRGVMGDEMVKSGKYRAIVLLEPLT